MKKLFVMLVCLMLVIGLCSCSKGSGDIADSTSQTAAQSGDTSSQLHTLASPKDSADVEWTPVYGEVFIADENGDEVLGKEEMKGFALVGSNDDDSYFEMMLSDMGKDMLKTLGNTFSFYVDGEKLCDFTYEETSDGTFKFGESLSFEELKKAATKIRGLE